MTFRFIMPPRAWGMGFSGIISDNIATPRTSILRSSQDAVAQATILFAGLTDMHIISSAQILRRWLLHGHEGPDMVFDN